MSNVSGQAYWDGRSQSYINDIEGPYHTNRLKMVEALLEGVSFGGTDCLDFGCGDGVFAERLLAEGAWGMGVDVGPVMVRAAEMRQEFAILHSLPPFLRRPSTSTISIAGPIRKRRTGPQGSDRNMMFMCTLFASISTCRT